MTKKIVLFFSILFLAACETPSQNVYDFREAGRSVLVDFGTIVSVRPITIKGPNTGAGATTGAVMGGLAGSHIGSGRGQIAGAAAGILVGAVAGAIAEEQIQKKKGIEYTIVTEKGKVMTIAQYYKQDEPVLPENARVMVQTSGSYQRVLPAEHLPEQIQRPKGIKVVD